MYMPLYMNRPTTFPHVIDKNLWNGKEQRNEDNLLSQGPQRRKEYRIHVPGLRIQAPDFWFPPPYSWILFFLLFSPEMGERGRLQDPLNILFFYFMEGQGKILKEQSRKGRK